MSMTPAQRIEAFHLAFLQVFLAGTRRERFILKGGTNLRYFFGSVRYSNDIDLDMVGPSSWRVEQAVDATLSGRALQKVLAVSGLAIAEGSISKAKQTSTTRRWRLGLLDPASPRAAPVRTTIELSGRDDGSDDVELAAVPASVVRPYALLAPTVLHYRLVPAIEQKIAALAERSETKARDVFDLELLFRLRDRLALPPPISPSQAHIAAERGLALAAADFEGQVAPFLDPDVADLYRAPGTWEAVRDSVAERLLALAGTSGSAGSSLATLFQQPSSGPPTSPDLGR